MPSKLPISALLNPVPEPSQTSSPSPASVNQADSMSATVAQTKPHRRKGVKKGVILPGSPPQDQVKYPVHVDYDSKFSAFHAEFGMEPTQVIANRHCHIPYDPKKRDFSQRTGRTGFDVFLYTFKVRDERTGLEQEEREMMWDYKNGLVRTTHLFRCNRSFDKTCPKRMLQSTPGLMPNAHNITGGNVIRQGYFVPWECARALATRFCWDVRYALTPIFGNDFPEDCLHPDHPDYRQWLIDPEIVHDSAEKQAMYCRLEVQASRLYLSPSPDAESTGYVENISACLSTVFLDYCAYPFKVS
ncbi:putative APSES transcription factor Xbp1 [Aspergillus saccharolyticus JOP 1030-1]|uniref:DNA-binding domain of Mlu1-box binding protein MBP1 n=1 Tax=Aspergillus saccharolyticus JOP 1030-1 TaxID=1450539 RepID=A0A319AK25_9EURO|nr:DNA-binding domain of Mlu1-box binding protein MBP1 [Aspergillus saccharolyticus JOP 1030-1]PYH46962.1 DNA-binding domain of Mlu1-box binding protein MBP1 [Aspergillus saccharolyticus JOP 1030-1]